MYAHSDVFLQKPWNYGDADFWFGLKDVESDNVSYLPHLIDNWQMREMVTGEVIPGYVVHWRFQLNHEGANWKLHAIAGFSRPEQFAEPSDSQLLNCESLSSYLEKKKKD